MGIASETKELRFTMTIPPGVELDKRRPLSTPLIDTTGLPRIESREYGRIVVLLGANGSGKSRLLKTIASNPTINGEKRKIVFVEGGRMLELPEGKGKNKQRPEYVQNDTLAKRAVRLLAHLESERYANEETYKQELVAWADGQCVNAMPTKKQAAIHRLNDIFSQLLPRRAINLADSKWSYTNNGVPCRFKEFSDGEKQALCLLGDVGIMSPAKSLIIVDEPELNLHPSLAMNLWNWIEDVRPGAVFFYATHSISFAMRKNVTDIIVLGEHDQEPMVLDRLSDSDGINWEPFLGAIPAFITTKRVLAVEGEDNKAFDCDFYRWILGSDITIVNVGSCHSVRAAVNHEGAWGKAGKAAICGLVDRDFRDDKKLEEFTSRGCIALGYHEAESYCCHPELLADAQQYSSTSRSRDDLVGYLVKVCSGKLLITTALQRAISKSENRMAIGPASGESPPNDVESARLAIQRWIESESPRVAKFETAVKDGFEAEYTLCKSAVDNKDVEQILALFPGKELLRPMLTFAGFRDSTHFMKVATQVLRPDKYKPLVQIIEAVREKLP